MSDPKPLKVTTCYDPAGRTVSCYALVEDTDEIRREHRLFHKHEEKVKQGLRDAIRERDDTISALRSEVGDLRSDVSGFGHDLQTIDLPAPVLGLEINREGWTDDDDLDDTEPATSPTDDLAGYAGEPVESAADLDNPVSTYADDDIAATVAFEPADLPTPATVHGLYSNDLA